MLEPKMWAKISFTEWDKKMFLYPGDRWGITFETDDNTYEAMKVMPDIHSPDLPEPFKSRYQVPSGGVSLPCNDHLMADSLTCEGLTFYCDYSNPDQMVDVTIQVTGEVYTLKQSCRDFFGSDINWDAAQ